MLRNPSYCLLLISLKNGYNCQFSNLLMTSLILLCFCYCVLRFSYYENWKIYNDLHNNDSVLAKSMITSRNPLQLIITSVVVELNPSFSLLHEELCSHHERYTQHKLMDLSSFFWNQYICINWYKSCTLSHLHCALHKKSTQWLIILKKQTNLKNKK